MTPDARFELYGSASCPYTREMREWLEWTGREFVEYDVERVFREARLARTARSRRRSAPCPCWSRTARSCRWDGKAAAVS